MPYLALLVFYTLSGVLRLRPNRNNPSLRELVFEYGEFSLPKTYLICDDVIYVGRMFINSKEYGIWFKPDDSLLGVYPEIAKQLEDLERYAQFQAPL